MKATDHREAQNYFIHGLIPLGLSNATPAHAADYMKRMQAERYHASIGRQYSALPGVPVAEIKEYHLARYRAGVGFSMNELREKVRSDISESAEAHFHAHTWNRPVLRGILNFVSESESLGIASEIMCDGGPGCVIEPVHGSHDYCVTHQRVR